MEEKKKELLFSLSKEKKDFVVQPFKGSGKGGQKRNKTMSACRIIHPASGAVSECQEERSFEQNKEKAFRRLIEQEKFQNWLKVEEARAMGKLDEIDKEVDEQMRHIKIETIKEGKWVETNV